MSQKKKNDIAKEYGKKQTENKTIPLEDTSITIPKGYTLVDPTTDETIEYADANNPTVNDGLVIKDDVGNEFVWVPVKEINEMVMCQTHPTSTITFDEETGQFTCNGEGHNGAETKLAGKLYATTTGKNFGTANTKYDANSGLREPAIVTGDGTGTGTRYDGDQTNLNNVVEGDQKTKEKFLEQLQNEFNEMAKSVANYKGFYIGRYETGNLEASDTTTPVVKKYNTKIGNVTWYWQYKNSKKIAQTGSGVTSSMIWGSQWDATMKWFINCGLTDYVTESTINGEIKGNYKDNEVKYKTSSSSSEETKAKDTSKVIPTGGSEQTKVNNIYDMAGNVYDWTIEANSTSYRVYRGRLLQQFGF